MIRRDEDGDELASEPEASSLNRALLVGAPVAVATSYVVVHTEMVAGRQIAILQLPPVAVGVLLLLVLANQCLKRFLRPLALSSAELMTVYVMACVSALISNRNQTGLFTICLPSINYFADPANQWQDRIFPFVKPWLVPFKPIVHGEPAPVGQLVIRKYFEGLGPGESVPWGNWLVPLACWSILFLSVLAAFVFLAALLRKPWVEHEKLVFPFTLVPVQLVGEDSLRSFFRSRLAWAGMGIPLFIYTVNFLHANYAAVPQIRLDWGSIQPYFTSWPWTLLGAPPFWVSLSAIGIAYFLHTDFVFSFWFFCWFYRLQWVALNVAGTSMNHEDYRFGMEGGAYCALALLLLRPLWRGLKAAIRTLIIPAPPVTTRRDKGLGHAPTSRTFARGDELLPARGAVAGLVLCCLVAATFLWQMGLPWWIGLFSILFYLFVEVLVRSRSVHEGGALMVEDGFRADDFLRLFPRGKGLSVVSSLPPTSIVSFALIGGTFARDLRGIAITPIMDGLKMCDSLKVKRRSLLMPVVVAVLIGYFCGLAFHLKVHYAHGVVNLAPDGKSYPIASSFWFFNAAVGRIEGGDKWVRGFPMTFVYTGLLTLLVGWMRSRFLWWPFHPLAMILSTGWAAICFWWPFLIGWMLKGTILRYGGGRLYEQAKPFFMGLILGEFGMAVIAAFLSTMDPGIQTPWMNIW